MVIKIPVPQPKPNESQDKFISRCISSLHHTDPERPDKQITAMCFSTWRSAKKEQIFSNVKGFETKEADNGDLIVKGYIATTHLDSGFQDEERDVWIKDRIDKKTLESWAEEINEGIPRSNKVSVKHERGPVVAGVGIKDKARVDMLPDGHYGLYTESLIDKTRDDFATIDHRIKNNFLDSFSIEFQTKDSMNNEYYDGAVIEHQKDGGIIRDLMPGTKLEGWTLASQPMNENCIMIKEVINKMNIKKEIKEDKMPEDEPKPESPPEQPEGEEGKEKINVSKKIETKEFKYEISNEDINLLKEIKELKKKEEKEKETKAITEKVKKELKEELNNVEVKNKIKTNPSENIEKKEFTEYKEIFAKDSKVPIIEQFKRAGRLMTKEMFLNSFASANFYSDISQKEVKNFAVNGRYLETKGLGITSNQETDTDYLLSAAELSDVFDPVIYNALNEATTTWNILQKDDFSQKGNNQVQFTLKVRGNLTAGAYTGNAVNTGTTKRQKCMTAMKKYQVGVEVDGDMIAAARGGPVGDIFALEVKDSTDTLMSEMNKDLFEEVGAETGAQVIGFEYITDNSGNGTLYNLTRSTTNKLSPDANGDTYINGSSADITLSNLRAAARQPKKEGANMANLVWVTSYIQGDKFRGIYDNSQRQPPTSARWGFEGRPEFEGIPIFEDKDCNDDDWWLIDLETHRIAVWVPPTLEMLGKDADSQKGFIKTYWCTFNRAPRRMVQIYGNATT